MTDLTVLYEDDWLLVVDKPAGLLMHPSWLDRRETDTLAGRIKTYLGRMKPDAKVHTVHRLDRPTSGLVLIGKEDQAARNLIAQFESRRVKKTYWAICRGFAPVEQIIDHPLKEELDRIADKYAAQDKDAQSALTQIRRLGIAELAIPVSRYPKMRVSWLECQPETGRKHQIRRHLKHLRYPIIGDTRHGCRHINQALEHIDADFGLGLRAVQLDFDHPVSGRRLSIRASVNQQWRVWMQHFGWHVNG
ncbi:MAG: pseudouridine synthase [Reinekea sp.]|jgi:tRNA pseudouridine65 synthase